MGMFLFILGYLFAASVSSVFLSLFCHCILKTRLVQKCYLPIWYCFLALTIYWGIAGIRFYLHSPPWNGPGPENGFNGLEWIVFRLPILSAGFIPAIPVFFTVLFNLPLLWKSKSSKNQEAN
jgi:hypothetical protein